LDASQQKAFEDLEFCLCSTPILILPDLQQSFEIETDASDYAIDAVLTQHGHRLAYHSEKLSDFIHRYPTYDKEMYSPKCNASTSLCQYMWKETIIHIDHRHLQFIQTQGKLQNDCHQKWSMHLQQFHMKYKKENTNHVVESLNRPSVVALTTVLNSCGHETFGWPQLYNDDSDFSPTYHTLSAAKLVPNFHLQDGLQCHLSHLYVPLREHAKLIW
jgi:hypothetical protein